MRAKLECLRREVEDKEIEAINMDNLRHSQSRGTEIGPYLLISVVEKFDIYIQRNSGMYMRKRVL